MAKKAKAPEVQTEEVKAGQGVVVGTDLLIKRT